jgi:nicotinic acid phosphoribosyltransferase
MEATYNAQAAADKEARRLVRIAYANGGTVSFSLRRLLELKLSLKVVRAVHRAGVAA